MRTPATRTLWIALALAGVAALAGCGRGGAELPTAPAETVVEDLEGGAVDPLANRNPVNVLLFVRTDCPIGNRYAPEIHRLRARFDEAGVGFWLVYPDPGESPELIRAHVRDYGFGMPALRDPEHVLVSAAGAGVTPEAAVYDASRTLRYRGRIDDRHVDFGVSRPEATRHEVADAVTAVLAGVAPPTAHEPAVGCFIPELR